MHGQNHFKFSGIFYFQWQKEIFENHITDFAAGMYPSTFIPEDHFRHSFPNSVFFLYFGTQDCGIKNPGADQFPEVFSFSDAGSEMKHDRVTCIQLACKELLHFILF